MYPASRHPGPPPGPSSNVGGPFKFTIVESCDRIKEEFGFLQAQYHSLKLEIEKLANEKTEMQRHYVMYYEMSYGLNVEMHKQTEIAKRLNAIIAQILPFLSSEHQQQVAAAVDRAKQVTMTELNAIIGQQMHQQQMPPHVAGAGGAGGHGGPPNPFNMHAAMAAAAAAGLGGGAGGPGMPPVSAAGLLALSGSLGAPPGSGLPPGHPGLAGLTGLPGVPGGSALPPTVKDGHGIRVGGPEPGDKRSASVDTDRHRNNNSFSPHSVSDLDHHMNRHRSRSPMESIENVVAATGGSGSSKSKKNRRENNSSSNNNSSNNNINSSNNNNNINNSSSTSNNNNNVNNSDKHGGGSGDHVSEDERSDADLVVDVANEDPISPSHNGDMAPSPRENGGNDDRGSSGGGGRGGGGDGRIKREPRPPSRSGSSSNSSTPVSNKGAKLEPGHGNNNEGEF